jgi:release factor glutamine methyltransferase
MTTIKEILTEARTRLKGPEASIDAELLLEAICAISRSRQFSHPDEQLLEDQVEQYKSALERRLSGEPLAHITGRRGFWDVDLRVTPDVLIPRSDTEILVEQALQRIPYNASWQIADLGTALARENATALGVNNISFVAGSWGQPLKLRQFDVILSNPPYIRTDDPHMLGGDLPAEPIQALVSGSDGLDAIRRIIEDSATCLKPNGWLLLEHGYDQAAEVSDLLQHADFNEIFTQKDYGGNSRVTGGRRQIEA